MKKSIITRKTKNGDYNFYYKGKNVTTLWMDFFSRLPVEKEEDCVRLFIKKYESLQEKTAFK